MSIKWAPFSAKQLDAIANSDARINAFDGPVRSGKTMAANVAWTHFLQSAPHKRLLMTGVTKETIYRNVLADLFEIWGSKNYRYNASAGIIRAFGREIHIVGVNDIKALKRIQGPTFGGWYADEITNYPIDVVRMALTRLSVEGARAWWTMNPDSPYHPIYREYLTNEKLLRGQNDRPPILKRWQFRLMDNLSLAQEYVDYLKTTFTGLWYKRMIEGLWVLAEGAIYDQFDPNVHVITWGQFEKLFGKREISSDWVRIRSVDFGYNHPFVCQWWAISPDGDCVMYREIYRTKRLVEDHARHIIELTGDEEIVATYADHDAEDRATLERHGVFTVPAVKDVSPGIQFVHRMLTPDRTRKRPRIFFLDDALVERDPDLAAAGLPTCTVEEFPTYVWAPPEKSNGLDVLVKEKDHGMDTTRYALYSHLAGSQFAFV